MSEQRESKAVAGSPFSAAPLLAAALRELRRPRWLDAELPEVREDAQVQPKPHTTSSMVNLPRRWGARG